MKFSFEKILILFFSLIFFGLAVLGFMSYKNNKSVNNNSKRVIRTHQVLFESAEVLSIIKDVQGASRGYVLTKDPTFLIDLQHARLRVLTHVDTLEYLTGDNPAQQIRVDSLRKIIEQRINHSLQTVFQTEKGISNPIVQLKLTNIGEDLMDEIRSLINDIQKEESELLVQRNRANLESSRSLNRSFFLLLLIAAILLIIGFIALKRHLTYRKIVETRIKKLNETLETRVIEKTNEIRRKEKHHHFVLDAMSEGIQVIDYNWRYVYVNDALSKQSKYEADHLLGNTMMRMYPGIENTETFKVIEKCMAERVSKKFENEFTYPDGTKGYYDLSIQPISEGLLILSTDISERKKSELAKELYVKEMEKVLFKISHEMRHPIVQILGISEVIGYANLSEDEMKSFLACMKDSAVTLDNYTRDLTNFVTSIRNKTNSTTVC